MADLDSSGDENESRSRHAVHDEVREETREELGHCARDEGQSGQQLSDSRWFDLRNVVMLV